MKKNKEPAFRLRKAGSAFYTSGSVLKTIFSFTTSILVSFLHLGQNNGNLIKTVSLYILVRVLLPHTGQLIH